MYWLNFYCCVSISFTIFPRESLTWDCYCICYEMDVEEMEVDGTENHGLRNDRIPKTLCGLDFCFHVFNKMYIDDVIALEQCDVIPGKHVILFRRYIDSRLTKIGFGNYLILSFCFTYVNDFGKIICVCIHHVIKKGHFQI